MLLAPTKLWLGCVSPQLQCLCHQHHHTNRQRFYNLLHVRLAHTARFTFDPWATPYGECLASDREELVPEARLDFDLAVPPL